MAKTRLIFQCLIVIGLLAGPDSGARVLAAASSRDETLLASQSAPRNTSWQADLDIPESFELVAENDTFKLYADRSTLAFKVLDKRSGYLWHSNLDEKAEGDRLNKTWTAFARSGISIDTLDQKAISGRLSITSSNASIEMLMIDQGFEATVNFTEASIKIVVIVRLEPAGVSVEVPFDRIEENDAEFKLGKLYVYPFMGATRNDSVPGYMFIPDGCGSLIQFGTETKAQNMFYGRYYGQDLGMITYLPWDPTINRPYKISIPVLGMVHGVKQNAYIAIVEKGASYGEFQAHPAGVITNFNFMLNTFVYNESYFQATNRSGAGVTTLQPETNAFDILIHYRFLTGEDGDYVGMARSYQQYLVDKGILSKMEGPDENIGIRLEFLGGDNEKILFWKHLITMTTLEQMSTILEDLEVSNPEVIYYGWQPQGASSMPPRSFRLDRNLGDEEQLAALIKTIEALGGNFSLYLDPQAALFLDSGYSARNDLAMSITSLNLEGYNRQKPNYFLNYEALSSRYSSLSADVFELQAGFALDGIGSVLYSDFKRGHFLDRENAIRMYQEMLAGNEGRLSFYMPNDYMFADMAAYYDIPLSDSGYIYTTEEVPFLQIVLAGYIPYYGPALNFSSNLQDDLLKHVDYGVYPSYFLTHDVTAKILNTSSNWIYTSSYGQWGREIEETYQWLNDLLGPVSGQEIVARKFLAEGVSATTYANGLQIIVNYTDKPYTIGGVVVNSMDAAIREVQP